MNPVAAPWPRPRIGLAACVEVAWRWWLVGLLGLLLLLFLLAGLQRMQAQGLREARLEIALQSLRERLETNLALGFELTDSHQAQAMLEDLLADDPTLVGAEVFDASAISLFSTDRGAIGEKVPPDWLRASMRAPSAAARASSEALTGAWSVAGEDDFTLGLPIYGPFGELVGNVCITSALAPAPPLWPLLAAGLAAALALSLIALLLARALLHQLAAQRDEVGTTAAATRLHAAEQRIASALDELARVQESA